MIFGTTCERPVFRLGREDSVWEFTPWAAAHKDGTFGNRWDDPRSYYRVLYASSERIGVFRETLARFRPDLDLLAELAVLGDPDPRVLSSGQLETTWLDTREVGLATLRGEYAEVDHSQTLDQLRRDLASRALEYGIPDVDAAAIRVSQPREFTQWISRYLYEVRDAEEERRFSGILYPSRLGQDIRNWAIFEGSAFEPLGDCARIAEDDPDFIDTINEFGIQLIKSDPSL